MFFLQKKTSPKFYGHGFDPLPPKRTMSKTKQIFFVEVFPKATTLLCILYFSSACFIISSLKANFNSRSHWKLTKRDSRGAISYPDNFQQYIYIISLKCVSFMTGDCIVLYGRKTYITRYKPSNCTTQISAQWFKGRNMRAGKKHKNWKFLYRIYENLWVNIIHIIDYF